MKYKISFLLAGVLMAVPGSAAAQDMSAMMEKASAMTGSTGTKQGKESGLLDTLAQTLGVTSSQAAGGTAALLNQAKANMSGDDFSSLLSAVPDLSSIMEGAGGFESMLGKSDLSLADQFSALGLDSGMIGKFTTQLLEYVQSEGGTEMMNLLKGALL